jgi:hypothetical protein
MVILLEKDTSKVGKTFLLIQILIGFGVFYCNFIFLITIESFLDTLVNMGAIMIINEFDDIFGKLLIIRL